MEREEDRLREAAAELHAAAAQLVSLINSFGETRAWAEGGIASFEQWLGIYAGLGRSTASDLISVGQALQSLPLIAATFAEGRLSFDKVRVIAPVATRDDEEAWLNLALSASTNQLARIAREARRLLTAEAEAEQRQKRGVWLQWQSDGMLRLVALLPPEDGAFIRAALEAAGRRLEHSLARDNSAESAKETSAMSHGDALVAICRRELETPTEGRPDQPVVRVLVHVDSDVLSGASPEGRCHIAGGPRLGIETARRLACDAELMEVRNDHRLPIDMGRARRIVSAPLRRALHVRDRGCRYPGCGVSAKQTHAHHVRHWAHGVRRISATCYRFAASTIGGSTTAPSGFR